MKLKRRWMAVVLVCFIFSAGCGAGKQVYLEAATEAQTEENTQTEAETAEAAETETFDTPVKELPKQTTAEERMQETPGSCYVYLCGAVVNPGVYEVASGSRIYEVIRLAGGLADDASVSSVNQAEEVCDGQMIFLPTAEEAQAGITAVELSGAAGTGEPSAGAERQDGRIDLNTATRQELMTLPGIGEAKADDILAYRTEHGGFSSAEEIMKIAGIKEGMYQRLKDSIKVK